MTLRSGELSPAWWRILKAVLRIRPSNAHSTLNFLKLKRAEPSVAQAFAEALESGAYQLVWMYTSTLKGSPLFLLGKQGRRWSLIYPERLTPEREVELVAAARLKSQRSLVSYMWSEESGWLSFTLFPFFAFLFGMAGYAAFFRADTAAFPDTMRLLGAMFYLAGAATALQPPIMCLVERHLLRRAFGQVGNDPLDTLDRTFDQTVKPSSSA